MFYLYTFQWHITNRCNWRCKHCYHDTYEAHNELNFEELKRVFHEFLILAEKTLKERQHKSRIVITGGEPFVHEYFLPLLEYMSSFKHIVDVTILTNGSLLTRELLTYIRNKAPIVDSFQISIEGDEAINDSIRGKGSFQKILNAISLLEGCKMNHHLAMTISRFNKDDIPSLIDLLLVYNTSLVIRRFVPIGNGKKNMETAMLSPQEMKEFYEQVREINQNFSIRPHATVLSSPYAKNPIKIENCLHGIDSSKEKIIAKSCGLPRKALIVVMPNGDVLPCRLLPKIIGNIRNSSLIDIYNSHGYDEYIDTSNRDNSCQSCSQFENCNGGALCITHAMYKEINKKDPQCWR